MAMELTFDYFKNLQTPDFYLCNPDGKALGCIAVRNPKLTQRFNDLSELTFEVPKPETSDEETSYYSKIVTKRLVNVDKIGWFQIARVQEFDDGKTVYKSVTAQSHQATFKDKGFLVEERVYSFYNPADPLDKDYTASHAAAMPSVVGQLYRQAGIAVNLYETDFTPEEDYGDWTLVYIEPRLYYRENAANNLCRAFSKTGAKYAYDFMVNDAEDAFEVIFDFDFLHHAIKVKSLESIAERTNIYLSFENLMEKLEVTEKADDIVTVLTCNGTDLDIRAVNPTGVNYIVDFSYYMDETNEQWMSKALIEKLKLWKNEVEAKKEAYSGLVLRLREQYEAFTKLSGKEIYLKKKLEELEAVRDAYITEEVSGNAAFLAETVMEGELSLDTGSPFHVIRFDSSGSKTCFKDPPTLKNGQFSTEGQAGDFASFNENAKKENLYFLDTGGTSYCKLKMGSSLGDDGMLVVYASGFERYVLYSEISIWLEYYELKYLTLKNALAAKTEEIKATENQMTEISSALNLPAYFSDTPALLKELKCYWIEGEYTNNTLAVLETTTQAEALDLAKELLTAGEKELEKVSRPRLSFTVNAVNFLNLYEFRHYGAELGLGKILTVEKGGGVFYYPLLTEMTFELDGSDTFELVFSTALKLTDWGITYADLVTSAASTARAVASNWKELTEYSKDKEAIENLIMNPLDKTLRRARTEAYNQQFIVDTTGVLGRRYLDDEDTFDVEQLRIINNLILFTNDGWKTAKTALGKITYEEDGQSKTSYGLCAEAIIGSLIMGNTLKISNQDNGVVIDSTGITIKNGDRVVFRAGIDGSLTVSNYCTLTELESKGYYTESTLKTALETSGGAINLSVAALINEAVDAHAGLKIGIVTDDKGKKVGVIDADADYIKFQADKFTIDSTNFKLEADGSITATSGWIGGWEIKTDELSKTLNGYTVALSSNIQELASGGATSAVSVSKDGEEVFSVNGYGKLYCKNADISGKINAAEGVIGGYSIANNKLFAGGAFTQGTYEIAINADSTEYSTYAANIAAVLNYKDFGTYVSVLEPGAVRASYINGGKTQTSSFGSDGIQMFNSSTPEHLFISATPGIDYSEQPDGFFYSTTSTDEYISKAAKKYAYYGIQYCLDSGCFAGMVGYIPKSTSVTPPSATLYLVGTSIRCRKTLSGTTQSTIYAESFSTTSDLRLKTDVKNITVENLELIDKITPRQFRYKNGDHRLHFGFVAQEVQQVFDELKMNYKGYGVLNLPQEEEDTYSIAYEEFIALLMFEIQRLKERIKKIERR